MPVRLRRRRTKGYRLPENSIYVGRPTRWGNRYRIGDTELHVDGTSVLVRDQAHAVALYREWFAWQQEHGYPPDLVPLRGRGGYLILGIKESGKRGGLGEPVERVFLIQVERVSRAEAAAGTCWSFMWDKRARRR